MAHTAILSSPAYATNAAVQLEAQYLAAGSFKVPGVLGFAGVNGTPRTATNADYHDWQSRAGFAYQFARNTVQCGGFGRLTQAGFSSGGQTGFSTSANLNATQDNFLTPYDKMANLGLRKNVKSPERVRLQLRADAFNALNHPRFGAPDANPSDAAFGRVTPTQLNQPRGVEFGIRVSY